MTDAIGTFFQDLADRGPQPVLANITGTVRFDLVGRQRSEDEPLQIRIESGAITFSEGPDPADCTMRADEAFFERLIGGRENAFSAVLRGEIECFGDVELLMAVQRIFPGPPDQTGKVPEPGGTR